MKISFPGQVLKSLERLALRPVVSVLSGPGDVLRHRRALRRGAVSKDRLLESRSTWWGRESRWFPGGTPPRRHNRVTPLIDGDSFFTALRSALDQAQNYVYVAGWCMTPQIPLGREDKKALVETRLLTLLSKSARRVPVRILLWSGAPALIQPTERSAKAAKDLIEREGEGDIVCRLDNSARFSHCHHQKAIVIDGRLAFVGGMDLTTFSGDRWDTNCHDLRAGQNWHDAQVMIEGEAAGDVESNFRQRWEAVTGDRSLPHKDAAFDPSWSTPVQIVRTIPAGAYKFARRGEFGIHYYYMQALRKAKRLIYIENQYIWSPDVMDALLDVINARHEEPFRVVIVMPAFAGDGRWDNDKHVAALTKADAGRGIVSIYSLYTSGPNIGEEPFTYRAIYVHAKVAVIDDEWLTVGSANLNNRGLVTDGEINAVVHDPDLARRVRLDLWAEHLSLPRDEVEKAAPADLADHAWKEQAEENARILKNGGRPLVSAVHSYTVGHKPSDLVMEDIQALTFEH